MTLVSSTARCPACEALLPDLHGSCEFCLRSPRERVAWLIAKWRAEGSFVEPPPAPSEAAVEVWRRRLKARRKAHEIGAAVLAKLPPVEETTAALERLIATLDDDDHELWHSGTSSDPDVQAALWRAAMSDLDKLTGVPLKITRPCTKPEHGPNYYRWEVFFSVEEDREIGRCSCQDLTIKLPEASTPEQLKAAWDEQARRERLHREAYLRWPPRYEEIDDGTVIDINAPARRSMLNGGRRGN